MFIASIEAHHKVRYEARHDAHHEVHYEARYEARQEAPCFMPGVRWDVLDMFVISILKVNLKTHL
jgi:hypothetical protein